MHGLESGDVVTFKEVYGMDFVNGKQFKIQGNCEVCGMDIVDEKHFKIQVNCD